jgi:acyl-CoA synthetase (AMP-forming)/AMP-acid ligase II
LAVAWHLHGPDILDFLEDAGAGSGTIRFFPDHPEPLPFAELWRRSGRAARWFSARFPENAAVAMVLATTPAAVAALVGAWRAGLVVASLPGPGRGMSAGEYQLQVEQACLQVGAELLAVDDVLVPLLPPLSVPAAGFAQCHDGTGGRTGGRGGLVQFTSGSTSAPKGVQIGLSAIAANVESILEVLAPEAGDCACSWLPLSHDMGLVGMLLSSCSAMRPAILGRAELCLIRPEYFLRDPASWLRICSETGATTTAAPDFGYGLAARTIGTAKRVDLSLLRTCLCGGEVVRWSTLERFAEASAAAGFRARAFCPAYGLAEATLAVTMVRPEQNAIVRYADALALADGEWHDVPAGQGQAVVSAGTCLPGMDCRIAEKNSGLGAVEVTGRSMFSGYVGAGPPFRSGGWFRTGDLGILIDGQLYLAGRYDDRIIVAGRNVDATQIEGSISGKGGIRHGGAAAVEDGDGGFAVVAETAEVPDPRQIADAVRDMLVRATGLAPSAVIFVPRGSLPKTPSGKLQRYRVRSLLRTGQFEQMAAVRFRGEAR